MSDFVIIFALVAVGLGLAVLGQLLKKFLDKRVVWPFYAKRVMGDAEQVLYHRLVKALPECIVLAQVQLSRVLGVKKGYNFGEWNNRINRLSLDYVVCLKDSSVVAAIELMTPRTKDQTGRKPIPENLQRFKRPGYRLFAGP